MSIWLILILIAAATAVLSLVAFMAAKETHYNPGPATDRWFAVGILSAVTTFILLVSSGWAWETESTWDEIHKLEDQLNVPKSADVDVDKDEITLTNGCVVGYDIRDSKPYLIEESALCPEGQSIKEIG